MAEVERIKRFDIKPTSSGYNGPRDYRVLGRNGAQFPRLNTSDRSHLSPQEYPGPEQLIDDILETLRMFYSENHRGFVVGEPRQNPEGIWTFPGTILRGTRQTGTANTRYIGSLVDDHRYQDVCQVFFNSLDPESGQNNAFMSEQHRNMAAPYVHKRLYR